MEERRLTKLETDLKEARGDIKIIKDNLIGSELPYVEGLLPTVRSHGKRLDEHESKIRDLEDKNKKSGLITGIKVGAGTAGGVTVGVSWPKIWSAILSMWHSL